MVLKSTSSAREYKTSPNSKEGKEHPNDVQEEEFHLLEEDLATEDVLLAQEEFALLTVSMSSKKSEIAHFGPSNPK